jgi:hypothetical protein
MPRRTAHDPFAAYAMRAGRIAAKAQAKARRKARSLVHCQDRSQRLQRTIFFNAMPIANLSTFLVGRSQRGPMNAFSVLIHESGKRYNFRSYEHAQAACAELASTGSLDARNYFGLLF